MTASGYRPTPLRWVHRTLRIGARIPRSVESLGFVTDFGWQVFGSIPFTLRHYRAETVRLITDMTWGKGSIIVGGGTVPMLMVLGIVMGAGTGIEAFSILDLLGMGPLTGIISSFANTRELAPIAAGIGFAAQAGCRMTAEIGAMRISEEIDAIESLGLRSIPFVVTTRVLAGAVAIVPTFLVALILAYLSCATVVVVVHGQSSGVYYHYFFQFVAGWDMVGAVVKVLVFVTAIILIHCYQGFFAAGGPEGVGVAAGRAVRASFVTIIALDMVLTILLWGPDSSIRFTG